MGVRLLFVMVILSISTGCAAKRPVLYPNELYRSTGAEKAQQEINDCLKQADQANAQGTLADEVALKTGKSALVGGATGAVIGAVLGRFVAGATAGAVTGSALDGLLFDRYECGDCGHTFD